MDNKNNKRKFKSLSSPSSQKITNFFKSVERSDLKSNSDSAGRSSEKDLPKPIRKQNTVEDVVPKSAKRDVDHSRIKEDDCAKENTIKRENSVKKNKITDEKCVKEKKCDKKNSINKEKCDKKNRINQEQNEKKIKKANIESVNNHDQLINVETNTSGIKSNNITKKGKCTQKTDSTISDKNIKNKDKLDDMKKKIKTKDKSLKNKSNSVGVLNLKKLFQDNISREKSESHKTRDNDSREIKHEASKNHKRHSDNNRDVDIKKNIINKRVNNSTNISKYLIFMSPEKNDKHKLIIDKHKNTNLADNSKREKVPKPDLRECEDRQKSEEKNPKINKKKRKRERSSSGTDNRIQGGEDVHKKGTSSSKNKCKTESDEKDCESVGSSKKKKRRYSSDLEQVKKADRKKKKFYKMAKNVNGLDSWLCKSLKTKQIHNKYGMKVPSYMNIMKNVQRRKQYSEQLKEACRIIEKQPSEESYVEKIEDADDGLHDIVLTCTHLSLEEIEKYFTCFMEDCLDIINGRVFHDRHDKYTSRAKKDLISTSFLVYNVSTVVFSIEQKKNLANLCEKHFNDCDIYKPMQYYFKVLIPELCLKIFMFVHNMDKDSAIKYLENMPILED